MTARRIRLGIVVSHPIQYHAPLYRRLAQSAVVDPCVVFLSKHGLAPSYDSGFGARIAFDVPLTEGFTHIFLPNRSRRPSIDTPYGLFNPGVASCIIRRSFDVVLVHGYAHSSDWLAFAGALVGRVPFMLRGESRIDTERAHSRRHKLTKRIMLRPIVRRAGACLAIGSLNREFYISYGADARRIVSAPYSVDNDRFAKDGDTGRSERVERLVRLGLDPTLPTILFASKLLTVKRPLDVLSALGRMKVPANLLVVGDGPERTTVEAAAHTSDRVRLLGFVNQTEIARWYGASDVFVLPSAHEPWGLAVNEAMAAGCVPVVSSAVGCAPDLITPETGRVVPLGDSFALASTFDELLSGEVSLRQMRKAARLAVQRHSIESTASGIETGCRMALATPASLPRHDSE